MSKEMPQSQHIILYIYTVPAKTKKKSRFSAKYLNGKFAISRRNVVYLWHKEEEIIKYRYKEDIYFFEVIIKNISSSVLKTPEFSRVPNE